MEENKILKERGKEGRKKQIVKMKIERRRGEKGEEEKEIVEKKKTK